MRKRAGDVAFVVLALLEWLGGGQRILRVQGGVAIDEVELAVVVVGGGLGDDLHLAAAGPVVLRRVGILVDPDLLNGGSGDGGAIGLHTVDHQAGAAGVAHARIEECAHGRGVVVVEDRQGLEIARSHHRGVVIGVGRGEVLAVVAIHADSGGDGGDGQNDVHRSGQRGAGWCGRCRGAGSSRGGGDHDRGAHGLKSRLRHHQREAACVRRDKLEVAFSIGVDGARNGAIGIQQVNLGAGDNGAGGICDHAVNRRSSGLRGGGGIGCKR